MLHQSILHVSGRAQDILPPFAFTSAEVVKRKYEKYEKELGRSKLILPGELNILVTSVKWDFERRWMGGGLKKNP